MTRRTYVTIGIVTFVAAGVVWDKVDRKLEDPHYISISDITASGTWMIQYGTHYGRLSYVVFVGEPSGSVRGPVATS